MWGVERLSFSFADNSLVTSCTYLGRASKSGVQPPSPSPAASVQLHFERLKSPEAGAKLFDWKCSALNFEQERRQIQAFCCFFRSSRIQNHSAESRWLRPVTSCHQPLQSDEHSGTGNQPLCHPRSTEHKSNPGTSTENLQRDVAAVCRWDGFLAVSVPPH